MDAKAIQFDVVPSPNVIQHLMPPHGGPTINAIIDEGEILNLVMDVDLLTTPFPFVKRY